MYTHKTRNKIFMLLFYYKIGNLQNKYDQSSNTNRLQMSHISLNIMDDVVFLKPS